MVCSYDQTHWVIKYKGKNVMAVELSQLELPTPSGNCKKAIELLSGSDANIKTLEAAISRDEILSTAIIRYSNSPVHRREVEITDVGTATNILGLKNVYVVLVTAVLKEYMQESITGDRIIQHCMTISALASLIGSKISKLLQYELELLGVLHELPSLVLCHNYRPEYRALVKSMTGNSPPLQQAEQEIFRVNRRDLVDVAMRKLFLPEKLRNILIEFHSMSTPEQAEKDKYLAALSLAHHMETSVVPQKQRLPDSAPGEKEKLLAMLGVSNDDYSELVNSSHDIISDHIALVA